MAIFTRSKRPTHVAPPPVEERPPVETGHAIEPDDYPTEAFPPSSLQIGGALLLIVAGFAAASLVARLGTGKKAPSS